MKNELTRLELKGRIKSLVETEFSASDLYLEIGNGKIKRTVIKLFNEYGNSGRLIKILESQFNIFNDDGNSGRVNKLLLLHINIFKKGGKSGKFNNLLSRI